MPWEVVAHWLVLEHQELRANLSNHTQRVSEFKEKERHSKTPNLPGSPQGVEVDGIDDMLLPRGAIG